MERLANALTRLTEYVSLPRNDDDVYYVEKEVDSFLDLRMSNPWILRQGLCYMDGKIFVDGGNPLKDTIDVEEERCMLKSMPRTDYFALVHEYALRAREGISERETFLQNEVTLLREQLETQKAAMSSIEKENRKLRDACEKAAVERGKFVQQIVALKKKDLKKSPRKKQNSAVRGVQVPPLPKQYTSKWNADIRDGMFQKVRNDVYLLGHAFHIYCMHVCLGILPERINDAIDTALRMFEEDDIDVFKACTSWSSARDHVQKQALVILHEAWAICDITVKDLIMTGNFDPEKHLFEDQNGAFHHLELVQHMRKSCKAFIESKKEERNETKKKVK